MARTELTAQIPDEDGVVESPVAANVDGFYFPHRSGQWMLEVINGDASPINVTLPTSYTSGVNALADNVIAVANSTRVKIKIPAALITNYLQTNPDTSAANSVVFVDFSAVANITVVLSQLS